MKLGIIVTGLFVMIGLFLFHVERMQDELEQLDRLDHKDNK
jgi:hypothetical protein